MSDVERRWVKQLLLHNYSEDFMGGSRGATWCGVETVAQQKTGLTKTFMDLNMPDGLPGRGFGLQLGLQDARPNVIPGQVRVI